MEWESEAILLTHRELGEDSLILEVFSQRNGRVRGFVRRPQRARNKLNWLIAQKGALVHVRWCARLQEQLGRFRVEPSCVCAPFLHDWFDSPLVWSVVPLVLALLRRCPEQHPYHDLFLQTCRLFACLSDANYVRWEAQLLRSLGFAIDLSACALTGATEDLVYVSPRTGRAASREAGKPWREKLLPLPPFLLTSNICDLTQPLPSKASIRDGLKLTGFFLKERGIVPRNHIFWQARTHFEEKI